MVVQITTLYNCGEQKSFSEYTAQKPCGGSDITAENHSGFHSHQHKNEATVGTGSLKLVRKRLNKDHHSEVWCKHIMTKHCFHMTAWLDNCMNVQVYICIYLCVQKAYLNSLSWLRVIEFVLLLNLFIRGSRSLLHTDRRLVSFCQETIVELSWSFRSLVCPHKKNKTLSLG